MSLVLHEMGIISVLAWRLGLYNVAIRRLLVVGVLVSTIVVFQCFGFASLRIYSVLDANRRSIALPRSTVTNVMPNVTYASNSNQDANGKEAKLDLELESDGESISRRGFSFEKGDINSFEVENHEDAIYSFTQKTPKYVDDPIKKDIIQRQVNDMQFASQGIPSNAIKNLDAGLSTSDLFITGKESSSGSGMQSVEMQPQNKKSHILKTPLIVLNNESKMGTSTMRSRLVWPTSLTQMNSLLLQSFNSSFMVGSSAILFQFEPF